jgi:hypothetical protein
VEIRIRERSVAVAAVARRHRGGERAASAQVPTRSRTRRGAGIAPAAPVVGTVIDVAAFCGWPGAAVKPSSALAEPCEQRTRRSCRGRDPRRICRPTRDVVRSGEGASPPPEPTEIPLPRPRGTALINGRECHCARILHRRRGARTRPAGQARPPIAATRSGADRRREPEDAIAERCGDP